MSERVDFLDEHPSLNKDFFEKILKEKYDTEAIVLKDFTFDATKDEGYGIQLTRVKLFYSFSNNDNMDIVCGTFMIKTRLIDKDTDDVLGKHNVFLKEAIFYLDILPDLYNIMEEKMVDSIFSPRCFAAQHTSSLIVLEDLSKKGYEKANNWSGLDFDHLKICLSKLAKLHAASDPPLLKVFKHSLLTSDTSELLQFFEKPLRICAEVSASWAGFEKISVKLRNLEATIVEKVVNMFQTSKFNVIIHGDLWSNNFLYSYDKDEKPMDVIMVDYSSGYWASPSIDLAYLLYSSSSADIGSIELCELIDHHHHHHHHHQELSNNLSILTYSGYIPSLDDINAEINANSVPIIAITTLVNGFRLSENPDTAKLLSMVEGSTFLVDLLCTSHFRNRMEFLLSYYDSMGFLD